MKQFISLSKMNLNLFIREPMALFATSIFPLVMLVIFGLIYGNTPDPDFSPDFGFLDYEFPAIVIMALGTMALLTIPIGQATEKELGIHRRFQATPMKPSAYFSAKLLTNALISFFGCVLMYIVAELVFDLRFETEFGRVAIAFIVSLLALFSIGYAIASLIKNNRTAAALGNILLFPSLFFAGVFMPVEMMPEWVQTISPFNPLTHIVNLMRGAWLGTELSELNKELLSTVAIFFIGLMVASFFWNRDISFGERKTTKSAVPISKKRQFKPKNRWVLLYWMHLKLFLREPTPAFFTLLFPLIILFIFGSIEPVGQNGLRQIDFLLPGYFGMIIATIGLMYIPIDIATWKEKQIVRRFQATPYPLFNVFSALGGMYISVIALGSLILYGVGRWVYDAKFYGTGSDLFYFFLAYGLSSAVMIVFGILIATLVTKTSLAQAIGTVLFFPMLFLSGATIPQAVMPEGVVTFAKIFPLTHMVNAMRGAWIGEVSYTPFLILGGMLVGFSLLIPIVTRLKSA